MSGETKRRYVRRDNYYGGNLAVETVDHGYPGYCEMSARIIWEAWGGHGTVSIDLEQEEIVEMIAVLTLIRDEMGDE